MVQSAEAKACSPGTRESGEVALEQWWWRIQSEIRVHNTWKFCGQWQALQNFADRNEMRNFSYNLYTFRTSSNLCHLVKLEKLYVTWSPWWVLAFLQSHSLHFCYPNLGPIWIKPFVSVYFHSFYCMRWTHKEVEDELFIKTIYFWDHLLPI